jgi:hypothetical protein
MSGSEERSLQSSVSSDSAHSSSTQQQTPLSGQLTPITTPTIMNENTTQISSHTSSSFSGVSTPIHTGHSLSFQMPALKSRQERYMKAQVTAFFLASCI